MEYIFSRRVRVLSPPFSPGLDLLSWGMPQGEAGEVSHGLALHLPPRGPQQDAVWGMATAKKPFTSNT